MTKNLPPVSTVTPEMIALEDMRSHFIGGMADTIIRPLNLPDENTANLAVMFSALAINCAEAGITEAEFVTMAQARASIHFEACVHTPDYSPKACALAQDLAATAGYVPGDVWILKADPDNGCDEQRATITHVVPAPTGEPMVYFDDGCGYHLAELAIWARKAPKRPSTKPAKRPSKARRAA